MKNRFISRIAGPQFLFNADGEGAGAGAPPATPNTPPVPQLPPEALPGFQSLVGRYGGSADAVATLLYNENHDLRRSNSELKQQLPKEGTVVLPQDEADALQKYRELGDLDSIRKGLEERDTYKTQTLTAAKNEQLRSVADVLRWDYDVFKDLDSLIGDASYEVRKVNAQDVPYIKFKENDEEKEMTVEEYVTQKRGKFLNSLRLAPQKAAPGNGPGPTPSGGPTGVDDKQAKEAHRSSVGYG